MERSIAFYENVMGCTVDKRQPKYGMVHMRAGNSLIDLVDIKGMLGGGNEVDQEHANSDHFCLQITPFDEEAILAHLKAHSVEVEMPAQDRYGAEGTGISLYIRDPDGNRVELKKSPAA